MIKFHGNGKNKYNAQIEIDKEMNRFRDWFENQSKIQTLHNVDWLSSMLQEIEAVGPMKILNDYKDSIPDTIFHMLKADILGLIKWESVLYLGGRFLGGNDSLSITIKYDYNNLFPHLTDTSPSEIYRRSPYYLFFLLQKSVYKLRIIDEIQDPSVIQIYGELGKRYSGLLKDALQLDILFWGNRGTKGLSTYILDSLWNDLEQNVHDPYVIKIVRQRNINFLQGSEAFPFAFLDVNNRIIRLKDLKGKVVLIDVWFTGCGGCEGYGDRLKNYIYPVFRSKKMLFS